MAQPRERRRGRRRKTLLFRFRCYIGGIWEWLVEWFQTEGNASHFLRASACLLALILFFIIAYALLQGDFVTPVRDREVHPASEELKSFSAPCPENP